MVERIDTIARLLVPASWRGWCFAVFLLLVLVPVIWRAVAVWASPYPHWSAARWDSAGLAPDPATTPEPVIQFYAARTWGWRGILGVHCWVAYKRRDAASYTRYEVVGWGVGDGRPALRHSARPPDAFWAGNRPVVLAEMRGGDGDALIARLVRAIHDYPFAGEYRLWPGPNSNTFIAYLARALPELQVELPPTAIGKDYLPPGDFAAVSPSGSGIQVSLLGLAGFTLGLHDGIEVNLFGLVLGLDLARPALKLPAIGRLGLAD